MAMPIDVGLSASGSDTLSTSLNSPFSVVGGGGSGAPSLMSAANNPKLWPYIALAAAIALVAMIYLRRK